MTKAIISLTLALAPLFLTGCNGAIVGNVVVLCVTFGIFFGTLRLGRSGESTQSEAPTSSTAERS